MNDQDRPVYEDREHMQYLDKTVGRMPLPIAGIEAKQNREREAQGLTGWWSPASWQ